MPKALFLIIVVLALVAVVTLEDAPADADLVFVNQNEVFTLDPQRMSYLQDLRLAHALYEGLVRWDNRDFSILGAAAALPEVSPDELVYRFRLHEDVAWSNGDPVTAHDFVYSWRRAILPDTAADYSHMFFTIDGAKAFFEWRAHQTRCFVADPWRDDRAADPAAVTAMADRLHGLLDAEPAGVALPPSNDREAVARELERLDAIAREGGPTLAVELAGAEHCRAWLERLGRAESREAEVLWMWQRALAHFDETVGMRAVDARTFEVRLARPTAYFLDLLCFGVFFPVHRPTVEGWPEEDRPAGGWHAGPAPPFVARELVSLNPKTGKLQQRHDWARPERHVGNGPFVLAEWRYKRDLRLERNPEYHRADAVRGDSVLALTIEDTNTAVLAFETGDVDWLADVSTDYQSDMLEQRDAYVKRYAVEIRAALDQGVSFDDALASLPPPEAGERRDIHRFPTFGTDFYSFNCRPTLSNGDANPFADAAVRRAFVLAIDKQVIVRQVTRLGEPVMTTLIPPGSILGYESPAGLPHDVDRARLELASAGWLDRDGDGLVEDETGAPFPIIDLLYTTNIPRYKWMSLDLKSQWEQALGVRIELRGTETKFYKEDLKQGKFMIARGRWYGDYGDPTTFLDLCRTDDGNNDRKYSNPVVDDLLDRAAEERDPARRMALLEECERIICDEDVPIMPICQLVQVYMYEPGRVRGLSDHPRLTQFLWQMEVVE